MILYNTCWNFIPRKKVYENNAFYDLVPIHYLYNLMTGLFANEETEAVTSVFSLINNLNNHKDKVQVIFAYH